MLCIGSLDKLPCNNNIQKKEVVFGVVAYYPGLTCSQITRIIRKKFSLSITNQGTCKLLNELTSTNVLTKNDFRYVVSDEWLQVTQKNIEIIKERETFLEKEVLLV